MSLAILNRPEFTVQELSAAINIRPNTYGLLGEQGLFTSKPLRVTTAPIDFKNGVMSLVPSSNRGSAGTPNISGKRTLREYAIPHFALTDPIYADDVTGIRAFGTDNQLQAVQDVVFEKQDEMGAKLDTTEEHLRIGAIKGDVIDADGSTLVNWFTEFDIPEKVVPNFGTANPTMLANTVKRHIEDNLLGDQMTHVRAYCSGSFWDALMENGDFKDAYKFFQNAQGSNPLRDDARMGFFYQGVEWMEYRGKAPFTQPDGSQVIREFIPEGDARFVPVGTRETFKSFYAPADYIETVSTLALDRYSKQWPDSSNKFVTLETQMNVLAACLRPGVLVRGTVGAP